jgi:hypothetical protein
LKAVEEQEAVAKVQQLKELEEMKNDGIITEEEFEEQKAKITAVKAKPPVPRPPALPPKRAGSTTGRKP